LIDGDCFNGRRHGGLTQPRAVLLDRRTRRLHFDLALEKRSLADSHARRKDVAFDLGGGADVDRLRGIQIALDLAVDDDDAGTSVPMVRLCVWVIDPSTLP
jgi:hypothetical protein